MHSRRRAGTIPTPTGEVRSAAGRGGCFTADPLSPRTATHRSGRCFLSNAARCVNGVPERPKSRPYDAICSVKFVRSGRRRRRAGLRARFQGGTDGGLGPPLHADPGRSRGMIDRPPLGYRITCRISSIETRPRERRASPRMSSSSTRSRAIASFSGVPSWTSRTGRPSISRSNFGQRKWTIANSRSSMTSVVSTTAAFVREKSSPRIACWVALAEDEQEDEVEGRHLGHRPLAGDAQDEPDEGVNRGGPQDHVHGVLLGCRAAAVMAGPSP